MRHPQGFVNKTALLSLGLLVGFVGGCRLGGLRQKNGAALPELSVSASPGDRASRETPVVRAIRKVSAAVVNISAEQTVTQSTNPFGGFFQNDPVFERFFADVYPKRQVQQNTLGSGVVVDPKGIVLTNHHVLLPAGKIHLTLADGSTHEATLIGGDAQFDIAILQMAGKAPFPYAQMGDSGDLMIGETVIAIGNPFGLESSVTTGVVSALDRSVRINKDRVYKGFIQTDALINPGNSGGPLVNINGEVIGINTAIYNEAQGIGFAIPVKRAQQVVAQLRAFGKVKKGWLGLRVKDLSPDLQDHFGLPSGLGGVLVSEVVKSSPATRGVVDPDTGFGRAGNLGPGNTSPLSPGDVILRVDGKPVTSTADFYEAVSNLIVGDKVDLERWAGESTHDVTVTAGEIGPGDAQGVLENLVGASLEFVSAQAREKYGLAADKGMVVTSVLTGSQSQRIGIRPGDVFLRVDNVELTKPKDVQDAVNLAYGKASFVALVQRGRQGYWITFEF